jgi:hypothetical protein
MIPKPITTASRRSKLVFISQAHVAPGMSLARWHEIVLEKHGLTANAKGDVWRDLPEATLDAIIADITAVVEQAQTAQAQTAQEGIS